MTGSSTVNGAFNVGGSLKANYGLAALGTISLPNNSLTLTELPTVAANTILGNNTGSTGNVVAFATSTLGIALSDTTGTLTVGRGGTGQTSFTSSQLLYGNGSNALSSVATSSVANRFSHIILGYCRGSSWRHRPHHHHGAGHLLAARAPTPSRRT